MKPSSSAVVSTFPPRRDGIAVYADQYAARCGDATLRIGDEGSIADAKIRFRRVRTPLGIWRLTSRGTDVHIMWHPMFHLPGPRPARAAAYVAWRLLAARRQLLVVVHEPEPSLGRGQAWCQKWFWRSAAEVRFHSRVERDVFLKTVGIALSPRLKIIEHHATFEPATRATHAEARRMLGIDVDARVALCIGFFGAHKGFDRAIAAFAKAGLGGRAQLYIVGSILQSSPHVEMHVDDLRHEALATPNVTLLERYVTDEEFDLWLVASDVVVLPYRTISSSSVAARARVLGRPVIATRAGGLGEQLGSESILVDDDAALTKALKARLVS